jgi:chemotaxis protein CheD
MKTDSSTLHAAALDACEPSDTVDVEPCTMAIIHESGTLRTVVSSGISVCLYDSCARIAAMNHFLFPRADDPHKATGRYGNAALWGLLDLFMRECATAEPVAYVAGGAYCDEFEMDAAVENVRMAWRFLLIKGIPIHTQHLGGCYPREVLFDLDSGAFSATYIRQGTSTTGRFLRRHVGG